jgi:hypothetical protein
MHTRIGFELKYEGAGAHPTSGSKLAVLLNCGPDRRAERRRVASDAHPRGRIAIICVPLRRQQSVVDDLAWHRVTMGDRRTIVTRA